LKTKPIELFLLALLVVFFVFPYFWIILSSFKKTTDILNPKALFNFTPSLENFKNLFNPFIYNFGKSLLDSALISTITSVLAVLIGIVSGYAYSRFNFFGRDNLLMLTLGTRMMPAISVAIPIFLVFRSLELTDTFIALFSIYTLFNVPLGVWLLTGYMNEIPRELDESAKLDGYSGLEIIYKVIIPLLWSGIVTVFLFSFINCWSEFLMSQILTGTNIRTVTRVASEFIMRGGRENDWGCMAAAATITTIPSFSLVLILQRRIVRGLTLGAVK
jgi:multiple sugar transport system permease protein